MRPYLLAAEFDLARLNDSALRGMFDSNNLEIYVQDRNPNIPDNFGVGVLVDAISCTVRTELNGIDELTMTYPVNGQLFSEIALRAVIVANVPGRGNQPYRIYRITKPLNGIVTVYARHLCYDLAGIVVRPFSASNIQGAFAGLVNNAMTENNFTFSTGRVTSAQFRVEVPTAVWDLLGGQEGSILDVYGGEYTFDGFTVRNSTRIGTNRGVSVRYGVNMTDLEQEENCANCYTGVVAYWQDEDEVVYSSVVSAAGTYGYTKVLSVDMSSDFEEKPSTAELNIAAAAYITDNQIGVPEVSWRVAFVTLAQTEEYKNIAPLETVELGDTVGVRFERLGVDASARVCAIEWDTLLERYNAVELGRLKANIATTIAVQERVIKEKPSRTEVANLSAVIAAGIMGAEGGSVRFLDTNDDGEPDTLYIADQPDPALATKVWRFNYEGWAASSNGYNGPFILGATLDGGIIANFVTAGIVQSVSGDFQINLDTGILSTMVSKTFEAADYSAADVSRISAIIGGATPTAAELEKYDFYEDGAVTLTDLVLAQAIVNTGVDLVINWTASINPGSRGETFCLVRELSGARTDTTTVFKAGLSGISAAEANINGTVYCNRLFINGTEVTP